MCSFFMPKLKFENPNILSSSLPDFIPALSKAHNIHFNLLKLNKLINRFYNELSN